MLTSTTIECYTCHQPTTEHDAQPIHLLLPTGRHRNGVELLKASQHVYECGSCFTASARADDEHLYIVSSCGTTRTVSATSHEEAAALFMIELGMRSTRSVAVCQGKRWTEYLDCEVVNGQLQYSERVELH
jgi:hypothetical protein